MDLPIKAKIFLKQDHQGSIGKPIVLSPVHVTSGSAQDIKYRVECPVWSKFEELPFDAVQSVHFDGDSLVYSTVGKKMNASDHIPLGESDFILTVEMESSDWCPIRIRVGCDENEELEGEVIFVRPVSNISDRNLKMSYNVVLFMDINSSNVAGRVRRQQIEYLETTLASFDLELLNERRAKMEELCRQMQLQLASCCDSNDSRE
jgi:hypothetical protein